MGERRNPDGWGRKAHQWRGRWRAYLTVGYKPDGAPDRKYVYGSTEKQCLQRLDELRQRHHAGAITGDASMTVAAYLTEWLEQKRLEVRPRTVDVYERELAHATPHLGRVKLSALSPVHIQRMMRAVQGSTTTVGKRTYTRTARAANQARGVLSNALDDAVRLGILASNPAKRVRPLRHEPEDIRIWTAAQVAQFLAVCRARNASQYALYYVALTTGMRAGELLALEWRDLHAGSIRVERTVTRQAGKVTIGSPKSRAARRTLPLPNDTIAILEEHRAGLRAAKVPGPYVFPTRTGQLLGQSNLRRALRTWAGAAGVPLIRPHDLRHTFASMAIASGMSPAELARQLGHTDASFTLRRYVHFFERARPKAAASLAELTGHAGAVGGTVGGTEAREAN